MLTRMSPGRTPAADAGEFGRRVFESDGRDGLGNEGLVIDLAVFEREFEVVEAIGDLLVFDRVIAGERVRCLFNLGGGSASRAFDLKPELLWSADALFVGKDLVLEPYSAAILKLS